MNSILAELLRTGTSPTPEGGSVPLQSNVLADEAEFLARVVREPGGVVAFDDADWPSVRRVVRYVTTNLAYTVHAAMSPRRQRWSTLRRLYEGFRGAAGSMLGAAEKLPGVGRAVREIFRPEW